MRPPLGNRAPNPPVFRQEELAWELFPFLDPLDYRPLQRTPLLSVSLEGRLLTGCFSFCHPRTGKQALNSLSGFKPAFFSLRFPLRSPPESRDYLLPLPFRKRCLSSGFGSLPSPPPSLAREGFFAKRWAPSRCADSMFLSRSHDFLSYGMHPATSPHTSGFLARAGGRRFSLVFVSLDGQRFKRLDKPTSC